MQTVVHGNLTFHVKDQGPRDGRVLMFANSLGTDLRVWDAMIAHLPEGLRLVRYDKRGHGLSDCPPAPYAIEELVADAAAVADALQVRDALFVGLSIGGLIGQGLAAARPDIVSRLVLMDTAAKIGSAEMWQERIDMLRAEGLEAIADGILDRWFAKGFRASEAARLWGNMLRRTPLEGYIGCCQAIAKADFRQVDRPVIPTMAMVGTEDGSTTPDVVKETAEMLGAAFHLIDDAGHLPCVEKPDESARLITDFLERTTT